MLHVFIVNVAPGHDPDKLLSDEVLAETQAQVMTADEARTLGFAGLPDEAPAGLRLIAVAPRDSRWIQQSLERSHSVTSYRMTEIG